MSPRRDCRKIKSPVWAVDEIDAKEMAGIPPYIKIFLKEKTPLNQSVAKAFLVTLEHRTTRSQPRQKTIKSKTPRKSKTRSF
jgi:hypothetical protein